MSALTAAEIMAALRTDPRVQEGGEDHLRLIEPFITHLPVLLADKLDQTITIVGVTEAKIAFLRYIMDNGYIERATEVLPAEVFGDEDDKRESIAEMKEALEMTLKQGESILPQLADQLAATGLTEEQLILSQGELSDECRKLYKAGRLTYAELLRHQPAMIVVNS